MVKKIIFKRNFVSTKEFQQQYGVSKKIFKLMLIALEKADEIKRKLGGRPNKVSLKDQLLMTLEYWREYRTYEHISKAYKIKGNTCFRNIQWVENILVKSGLFNLPNKRKVMEKKVKTMIVDATEVAIEKPSKNQRKYYSGKKKLIQLKLKL